MIVPFENLPQQKFDIIVNKISYTFTTNYNTAYKYFTLDILSDAVDVKGIKIVAGIDICEQYPDIPFILKSDDISDPTLDNLNMFRLEVL